MTELEIQRHRLECIREIVKMQIADGNDMRVKTTLKMAEALMNFIESGKAPQSI